jgi:hypothetical protein
LDSDFTRIKQSSDHKFKPLKTYEHVAAKELELLILKRSRALLVDEEDQQALRVYVEYHTGNYTYELVGGKNPIRHGGIERFQLNFAMLSSIRDCTIRAFDMETQEKRFYDFFLRLRDDSFVFSDWTLKPALYSNGVADIHPGSWDGLNDHTLVVARRWADHMFRGPVEEYYLKNLQDFGNTEGVFLQIVEEYNITVTYLSICELPLVPLRGIANRTHWNLHRVYARKYDREATDEPRHNNCSGLEALRSSTTPILCPDMASLCR